MGKEPTTLDVKKNQSYNNDRRVLGNQNHFFYFHESVEFTPLEIHTQKRKNTHKHTI